MFCVIRSYAKKVFCWNCCLLPFFFAFFFCGCLAKVVLRQRVKKNYCSSNTKVKCICISIFRKNVLVIHFDNTKNRQLFILTTQKIVSYSFSQHKKWYLSKKSFFLLKLFLLPPLEVSTWDLCKEKIRKQSRKCKM